MNVPLFVELCKQAIDTSDPITVSELNQKITRLLDLKRKDLNALRRRGLMLQPSPHRPHVGERKQAA